MVRAGHPSRNRVYVGHGHGIYIADRENVVQLDSVLKFSTYYEGARPYPVYEIEFEASRAEIAELDVILETMKYDKEDASNGAARLRNRIRLESAHTTE